MTREKVINTINEIVDRYHFTEIDGALKGKYFPNNVVLMSLSYLLDRNHLIIGDPGWGKTTLAQILSSKFSGIPFDLYESLTVEGHPGLFTEKWKARPHYGSLTQGVEKVIWQGSFGLDTFIVDEINRVSPDVQDEMLEGIRTGRWTYMNDVLYEGKKPTFLTMNDRDNGNGSLIPPLEDRIDIVTEECVGSPLNDYRVAEKRIRDNLSDPRVTTSALDELNKMDFAQFKSIIARNKKGDYLTADEKRSIQESIENIPYTNDALYFLWTFASEINYNFRYGKKRARDPISDDDHDKQFAGIHVKNSFSARPEMATQVYSKGLAWFLGDEKVELDHIRYVLPYVTAHKLDFTDDFRDKHGNDIRTDYEDLHLAKKLVELVEENYSKSIKPLRNIIADIQAEKIKIKDASKGIFIVNGKKTTKDDFDHPLLRHIIENKILSQKSNIK